jgi:hypothetical protein
MSLLVLSDIHYASPAEQARRGHESAIIRNPVLRLAARFYRRYVWLADPYGQNHLLDEAIALNPSPEIVVANGDYTLDTAFVGVSDDAAFASAATCLGKLRQAYGERLLATIGDHELGKLILFGGAGGMRLASWFRTVNELRLAPFWQRSIGRRKLVGITSSLVALPLFEPELLSAERSDWEQLRREQLHAIRECFDQLQSDESVLLFCHDPSALPFLHREEAVRTRLGQVEATVIGHLHTQLVFQASRVLAGMPALRGLGNSARRMSQALREARCWREFRVVLCPSLAGCELLKDGGFLVGASQQTPEEPPLLERRRLPR